MRPNRLVLALALAICSLPLSALAQESGETADPAQEAENEEWDADQRDRLGVALEGLDARSKDILRRRWLADEKATLHELAAEYGVSAERIRQIEVAAMKRLRAALAA